MLERDRKLSISEVRQLDNYNIQRLESQTVNIFLLGSLINKGWKSIIRIKERLNRDRQQYLNFRLNFLVNRIIKKKAV